MCAVLLMLVMCFGPVPAEAQAEGAPPDSARRYTVEYTVNGTRWPDWTFITQAESAAQALAAAPDHLRELGGDYENCRSRRQKAQCSLWRTGRKSALPVRLW